MIFKIVFSDRRRKDRFIKAVSRQDAIATARVLFKCGFAISLVRAL